jgi:hypothetical protein
MMGGAAAALASEAAEPTAAPGAPNSPPQIPGRAELGGWYDAASNAEMVRGEVAPDKGTPTNEAPPSGTAPAEPGGKPGTMLSALREYQPFNLPEDFKFDDGRLKDFTGVLDAADLNHQDRAQRLIDMHTAEMKSVHEQVAKHQRDVWSSLNDGWKRDFRADPELGGHNAERTLGTAKAVIEEYGGSHEQQAELLRHVEHNGMGNYPGFLRLLANIGKALNVYEENPVSGQVRPHVGSSGGRGPGNRGWYGSGS